MSNPSPGAHSSPAGLLCFWCLNTISFILLSLDVFNSLKMYNPIWGDDLFSIHLDLLEEILVSKIKDSHITSFQGKTGTQLGVLSRLHGPDESEPPFFCCLFPDICEEKA